MVEVGTNQVILDASKALTSLQLEFNLRYKAQDGRDGNKIKIIDERELPVPTIFSSRPNSIFHARSKTKCNLSKFGLKQRLVLVSLG